MTCKFLNYDELQELVKAQDEWKPVAAGEKTIIRLLCLRHPITEERITDLLFRSQQVELLRQVLQQCSEVDDPLKLLIMSQAGHAVIAAMLQIYREPLSDSISPEGLWQRCLCCTAPEAVWDMQEPPAKWHYLPWWALQHKEPKVLAMLLEGQDATLLFADGSNLLHEAVALTTPDHVPVLVQCVRNQMTPADMMAEDPIDRQFLNYMDSTRKTALYKLVTQYEQLSKMDAEYIEREERSRQAAAKRSKKQKKDDNKERLLERLRRKAEAKQAMNMTDPVIDSSSSDFETESSSEDESNRQGTISRLQDALFGVGKGLGAALGLGGSTDPADDAVQGSNSSGEDSDGSATAADQLLSSSQASNSAAAASSSSTTAGQAMGLHPALQKKEDTKFNLQQVRAKERDVQKMILQLCQAGADPLVEVMLTFAESAVCSKVQLLLEGSQAQEVANQLESQERDRQEQKRKEQERLAREQKEAMLQQQRGSSKKGLRRSDIRDMFKDDTSDWELAVRNVYSTITDTRALAAAGSAAYSSLRIRATGLVAAAKILTKNLRVAATATALDRLIWDPKDHRKYTDDEISIMQQKKVERKQKKLKAQITGVEGGRDREELDTFIHHGSVQIYNPLVEVPFQPDEIQAALLQAALRCMVFKVRGYTNVVTQLSAKMKERSRPKVAAYLEKLSATHEDQDGFPKAELWRHAHESLLLSLVRCGVGPDKLQHHSRPPSKKASSASTAGLSESIPQRNAMWVALAAQPQVFTMLVRFGRLQLEYTTGGNLLHALLHYNPRDDQRMAGLLDAIKPLDRRSKHLVLDMLHSSTQQTPLFKALVTQQFDMVDKLLAAGADPLIQCQHAKRTTALHVLFEDFEQHKAEYSALLTEVLTAALVLERQDRQGVPVPVGDVLNGAVGDKDNTVLLAATHYALKHQDAAAAMKLFDFGARATKPNAHGVSPLLVLLRRLQARPVAGREEHGAAELKLLFDTKLPLVWTKQALLEVMPTTLGPQDVQLLLKWLEQHYVHVIDPYVGDLEVHMTFIKETDIWPMAKLLLQHAQSQLAAAEEGSSHAALLPQLFSRTRPHSYIHKLNYEVVTSMLALGTKLETQVMPSKQTLLHAALDARCPDDVVLLLLEKSPVEVLMMEDSRLNTPLHLAAALLDTAPQRLPMVQALMQRCLEDHASMRVFWRLNYLRRKPEEVPTGADARAAIEHYRSMAYKKMSSAAGIEDEEEVTDSQTTAVTASAGGAASGLTGQYSQTHIEQLLAELPASKPLLEDESSKQQAKAVSKQVERLVMWLGDAAAGRPLTCPPQLAAEIAHLKLAKHHVGKHWGAKIWEVTLTRDALQHWAELEQSLRKVVLCRLSNIAEGLWHLKDCHQPQSQQRGAQQSVFDASERQQLSNALQDRSRGDAYVMLQRLSTIRAYATPFLQVGSIIWEVTPDYSHKYSCYVDMIRVWGIVMSPEEKAAILSHIAASYSRTGDVLDTKLLKPIGLSGSENQPVYYNIVQDMAADAAAAAAYNMPLAFAQPRPTQGDEHGPANSRSNDGLVKYCPPASYNAREFTMLRLYDLTPNLIRRVISEQMDLRHEDFPFRLSVKEQEILELAPKPDGPRMPVLVMGRSGTGKTTCIVQRLFHQWCEARHYLKQNHDTAKPMRQLFVTASPTLKDQVAKQFRKLQATVLGPEDMARVSAAVGQTYHSLSCIPDEAFPLFVSNHQYLRMLDATVAIPFFRNRDRQTCAMLDDTDSEEQLEMALDLDAEQEQAVEATDPSVIPESNGRSVAVPTRTASGSRRTRKRAHSAAGTASGVERELTFALFEKLWSQLEGDGDKGKKGLESHLVFQEIMSYIKGSAEAVQSQTGMLGMEEYLSLGAKRASNYNQDLRAAVYGLMKCYRQVKMQNRLYDRPDLVHHLYKQMSRDGYRGGPVTHICRDEVQDFIQGELLLDKLVLGPEHAGQLFYCGDTAQTIARGVGFRFTDVKSMLIQQHQELAQKHRVQIDEPQLHRLDVNYRSHAGILDVANSVVSVMQQYFPSSMDRMPRERAFFDGPAPLLLGEVSAEEVAILTSGGKHRRRVEFGAHMCLLVRHAEDKEKLPLAIRASNALIMDVVASKGLEFDDVILVDFLSSSPDAKHWRVLLSYLRNELETHASVKAEQEAVAALEAEYGGDAAVMINGLIAGQHSRRKLLEDVPLLQDEEKCLIEAPFEPELHTALVQDLKHLYVGITRAKSNLIMFESDPFKRAPLYYYLRRLGLAVEVKVSLAYDDAGTLLQHTSNTPADWADRAIEMQQQQLWELAAKCYSQAGDWLREAAARAKAIIDQAQTKEQQQAAKAAAFEEAVVLLVEAAAGAAKQRAAVAGASGGAAAGDAVAPPITAAEWQQWLSLAANVLGSSVLNRWAESASIYCQLERFAQAEPQLQQLVDWLSDFDSDLQDLRLATGYGIQRQAKKAADKLAAAASAATAAIEAVRTAVAAAKTAVGTIGVGKQQQVYSRTANQLPAAVAEALHTSCIQLVLLSRAAEEDRAAAQQIRETAVHTNNVAAAAAGLNRSAPPAAASAASSSSNGAAASPTADLLAEAKVAAAAAARAEREAEQQQRQQEEHEEAKRKQQLQELLTKQQQQQQETAETDVFWEEQQQHEQNAGGLRQDFENGSTDSDSKQQQQQQQQRPQSKETLEVSLPDDSQLKPLKRHVDVSAESATSAVRRLCNAGSSSSLGSSSSSYNPTQQQQQQQVCGRCGMIGHALDACNQPHCSKCKKFWHEIAQCKQACSRCGCLDHSSLSSGSFNSNGGSSNSCCSVSFCRRCSRYGHSIQQCPYPAGFKRDDSLRKPSSTGSAEIKKGGSLEAKQLQQLQQQGYQLAAPAAVNGAHDAVADERQQQQPAVGLKRSKQQQQQLFELPKPRHEQLSRQRKQQEVLDRQEEQRRLSQQQQQQQQEADRGHSSECLQQQLSPGQHEKDLEQQQLLQQQNQQQETKQQQPLQRKQSQQHTAAQQQQQLRTDPQQRVPPSLNIPIAIPVAIPIPISVPTINSQPAATQPTAAAATPDVTASAPRQPVAYGPSLAMSRSYQSLSVSTPQSASSTSSAATASAGCSHIGVAAAAAAATAAPAAVTGGTFVDPFSRLPPHLRVSMAAKQAAATPAAAAAPLQLSPLLLPAPLVIPPAGAAVAGREPGTGAGTAEPDSAAGTADTAVLQQQVANLQLDLEREKQLRVAAELLVAGQQQEIQQLKQQLEATRLQIKLLQPQ